MASGLVALLDDVAGIARLAATSVDDVATASATAGSKAVGVVVDDAAVTPAYVSGLSPTRELPMIARIAMGSIRNKIVILLPIALVLGSLAPWAITPILMCGGTYLAYEGAEKVAEWLGLASHHESAIQSEPSDPAHLERSRVKAAIRTDLILSAEIMAISLASVSDRPLAIQALSLAVVGLLITVLVYGAVGIIVKMDDVGLHLALRPSPIAKTVGRGLVKGMLPLMTSLSTIGTIAMLWVGGGIFLHGLEGFGLEWAPSVVHHAGAAASSAVPFGSGPMRWLVEAGGASAFGLLLGAAAACMLPLLARIAAIKR